LVAEGKEGVDESRREMINMLSFRQSAVSTMGRCTQSMTENVDGETGRLCVVSTIGRCALIVRSCHAFLVSHWNPRNMG
jgi:hypothetical protein